MDELISTFHIDWKIMIAQLVNFALVFLALYFLAAKPLTKLMTERKKEITEGLENAEQCKIELVNANLQKEEILKEAQNSAQKIFVESQHTCKDIIKEANEQAALEKENMLKQAKLEVEREKKGSEELLRREAASLVTEGIRKSIEGYVGAGKGDDIINAILKKA